MKKMLNFYIALGFLGGVFIAISLAGYRIHSRKINEKSAEESLNQQIRNRDTILNLSIKNYIEASSERDNNKREIIQSIEKNKPTIKTNDLHQYHLAFEIGYSQIIFANLNVNRNESELIKWQKYVSLCSKKLGMNKVKPSEININNFDVFARDVYMQLKTFENSKVIDYFLIPYNYSLYVNQVLNQDNCDMSMFDEIIKKIDLPQEYKEKYYKVKAENLDCKNENRMLAINNFLSYLNEIREYLEKNK